MTITNSDANAQGSAALERGALLPEQTVTHTMKDHLHWLVAEMRPRGYTEAQFLFKRHFIITVLISCKGNQCKAARELGMHRNTFSRTCATLRIDARYITQLCRDYHPDVVRRKCAVISIERGQQ